METMSKAEELRDLVVSDVLEQYKSEEEVEIKVDLGTLDCLTNMISSNKKAEAELERIRMELEKAEMENRLELEKQRIEIEARMALEAQKAEFDVKKAEIEAEAGDKRSTKDVIRTIIDVVGRLAVAGLTLFGIWRQTSTVSRAEETETYVRSDSQKYWIKPHM